jgi:hypothetical protein
VSELPEVADIVRQRERTERALSRAVRRFPPSEPDPPRGRAEAFQARQREQREAEERHERLVREALNERPPPPVADELRDFAGWQRSGRRLARRRGRVRL